MEATQVTTATSDKAQKVHEWAAQPKSQKQPWHQVIALNKRRISECCLQENSHHRREE
jgi:hypothetical protein